MERLQEILNTLSGIEAEVYYAKYNTEEEHAAYCQLDNDLKAAIQNIHRLTGLTIS